MGRLLIDRWDMQLRSTITIQDNITRLATQQEELIRELRGLTAQDAGQRTSEQNRNYVDPARNESFAVERGSGEGTPKHVRTPNITAASFPGRSGL